MAEFADYFVFAQRLQGALREALCWIDPSCSPVIYPSRYMLDFGSFHSSMKHIVQASSIGTPGESSASQPCNYF
jgi:hypothetical protein